MKAIVIHRFGPQITGGSDMTPSAIRAEAKGAPVSHDEVMRATRDSVRALMMIRAYRMRGHLHANLDPLGLEPRPDHVELHPSSYGFKESDWDRNIFIDHVLGLEFATINEMLALLRRTYCSTIGFEFMHISDPAAKAWIQQRIEGPDKEIAFINKRDAGAIKFRFYAIFNFLLFGKFSCPPVKIDQVFAVIRVI